MTLMTSAAIVTSARTTVTVASAAVARRALFAFAARARGRWRQRRQQFRLDFFDRQLMADVGLDVGQREHVALAGEAHGVAALTGTRGAADAVHVILGV